jgi:hypothetical protein
MGSLWVISSSGFSLGSESDFWMMGSLLGY